MDAHFDVRACYTLITAWRIARTGPHTLKGARPAKRLGLLVLAWLSTILVIALS